MISPVADFGLLNIASDARSCERKVTFAAAPTVSGKPLLGRTLKASASPATPSTATPSYQWLRDGTAITGADGPTYVVRKRDVGHHITPRVTLGAPHWASTAKRARAGTVSTVPQVTAKVATRTTSAVLNVRVATPGLADPEGKVRVYEHRRLVATLVITDHRAHARLRHLSPGTHRLVLRYSGPGPQVARSARVAFTTG